MLLHFLQNSNMYCWEIMSTLVMCWQKPSPPWWQKWSLSLITDCNYSHVLMQAPTKVAKSTWISLLYWEIQQKRLLHMKMFTRWHSSFAYINRKLRELFVANWTSVGLGKQGRLGSTLKFDFRASSIPQAFLKIIIYFPCFLLCWILLDSDAFFDIF